MVIFHQIFKWETATLAPIAALFELIFQASGFGGFAAETRSLKNSECGKREKASNKNKKQPDNKLSGCFYIEQD
ncbi:hypothetical protein SB689_21495 [Chryseobacterium sp. SIMBA_038]